MFTEKSKMFLKEIVMIEPLIDSMKKQYIDYFPAWNQVIEFYLQLTRRWANTKPIAVSAAKELSSAAKEPSTRAGKKRTRKS